MADEAIGFEVKPLAKMTQVHTDGALARRLTCDGPLGAHLWLQATRPPQQLHPPVNCSIDFQSSTKQNQPVVTALLKSQVLAYASN